MKQDESIVGFLSYIPSLVDVLRKEQPKTILEWGTGISTAIIKGICPNAKIISIEHSKKWYWWYKMKFRNVEGIEIIYCRNLNKYPFIYNKEVDLAFIDGRERVECLKVAFKIAKTTILHDANRDIYSEAIKLFSCVTKNNNTMVLKK